MAATKSQPTEKRRSRTELEGTVEEAEDGQQRVDG